MLSCVEVVACRGGRPVLNDVSLRVSAGERVAIVGRSGAGKSTLLAVLAGLVPADAGHVVVDGVDLTGLGEPERRRVRLERIGMVTQFGDLLDELTIVENVELPVRLGRPGGGWSAPDALAALEIDHLARRRPSEVSGGERQRAAIARAVVGRTRVVLADEPTGALDDDTATSVSRLLAEVTAELGCATVIGTHDPLLVSHVDRVLRLDRGRLVEA